MARTVGLIPGKGKRKPAPPKPDPKPENNSKESADNK